MKKKVLISCGIISFLTLSVVGYYITQKPMEPEVLPPDVKPLEVSSPHFKNNAPIPQDFTCDSLGKNLFPHVFVNGFKSGEKSLAFIVDDPDAPNGTRVHFIVYNFPVSAEKAEISDKTFSKAMFGTTSNVLNPTGRSGPCPPAKYGVHRYFFKVYGLKEIIHLPPELTKDQLLEQISPLILSYGEFVGTYERK